MWRGGREHVLRAAAAPTLARAFGVSNAAAGLLITATQFGYVVVLALLVPLGDRLERRRPITTTLLITAAAQALAAASPAFGVFAVAIVVVGITSVVAQVIVPMSSLLAAPHERGRVVGTVMSGLLVGILLARTLSGLVAGLLGWRSVYVFAAAAMLLLAAVLWRALPRVPVSEKLPYRALLASVVNLVRSSSRARRTATATRSSACRLLPRRRGGIGRHLGDLRLQGLVGRVRARHGHGGDRPRRVDRDRAGAERSRARHRRAPYTPGRERRLSGSRRTRVRCAVRARS